MVQEYILFCMSVYLGPFQAKHKSRMNEYQLMNIARVHRWQLIYISRRGLHPTHHSTLIWTVSKSNQCA